MASHVLLVGLGCQLFPCGLSPRRRWPGPFVSEFREVSREQRHLSNLGSQLHNLTSALRAGQSHVHGQARFKGPSGKRSSEVTLRRDEGTCWDGRNPSTAAGCSVRRPGVVEGVRSH